MGLYSIGLWKHINNLIWATKLEPVRLGSIPSGFETIPGRQFEPSNQSPLDGALFYRALKKYKESDFRHQIKALWMGLYSIGLWKNIKNLICATKSKPILQIKADSIGLWKHVLNSISAQHTEPWWYSLKGSLKSVSRCDNRLVAKKKPLRGNFDENLEPRVKILKSMKKQQKIWAPWGGAGGSWSLGMYDYQTHHFQQLSGWK